MTPGMFDGSDFLTHRKALLVSFAQRCLNVRKKLIRQFVFTRRALKEGNPHTRSVGRKPAMRKRVPERHDFTKKLIERGFFMPF